MLDVENILVDLDGETECGEDLDYDRLLIEIRESIEGEPERQVGDEIIPAVEPDWKLIRRNCLELSKKTHNLEIAVSLTRALLQLEGFSGLAAASDLLAGMIEKYWSCLYPPLDSDDQPPSEVRLMRLYVFDSHTFLLEVKKTEILSSKGVGSVSLDEIHKSREQEDENSDAGKLIDAVFLSAPQEAKEKAYKTIEQCIDNFKRISAFCMQEESVGDINAPRFEELLKVLNEAKSVVGLHLNVSEVASSEVAGEVMNTVLGQEANSSQGLGGAANSAMQGINSRKDVIKAIDEIEKYYRQNEPGSPIPLILKRAKALVDKDFMALMEDLAPDSIRQLEVIVGVQESGDN